MLCGERSTTVGSYAVPAGGFQWSRTVSGLSLPSQSSVTDETVMVDDATGFVLSSGGVVTHRYDDVWDAQFDEGGELVLLHRDGSVEWLPG